MYITVYQNGGSLVSIYTETVMERQDVESMLSELGISFVTAFFAITGKISNIHSLVARSIKDIQHIRHTLINE